MLHVVHCEFLLPTKLVFRYCWWQIVHIKNKQQVSGETQRVKHKREGSEKREMNTLRGRKWDHRDKTPTGRERQRAMNFLPSVNVLVGWYYVRTECTHTNYLRLVELIT